MKKNSGSVIGIGLIVIGLFSVLVNVNIIDIEFWELWPFFILALGLVFEIGYFTGNKKDVGLLVPAGILMTISCIFIVNVIFGWYMMSYLWPLFIMAPGIGIFQMYVFSKNRDAGLLIPSGLSLAIGGYFLISNFFNFVDFPLFISIVLIVIGLLLVFKKSVKLPEVE